MKNYRGLNQVCTALGGNRLLLILGSVILWGALSPVAESQSAVLDHASSLPQIPLEKSNPGLSYQSPANTVFDNDSQLDQASLKFAKNGYEIDLTFRAHPGTGVKIFWPSGEEFGLGLITCDVDQDGDQDLVLTSPTSLFPLAIWISDGTGRFQEGDHTFYLPLFSNDHHPAFHPSKKLDKQICFPRQRRVSVDLSRDTEKAANLEISALANWSSLAPLPRRRAFSLSSRSPPEILSS